MAVCFFCKAELNIKGRVMRKDVCASCGRDLHCCAQCRFHDPRYHNQCREPKADMIKEREKANLCDYFELGAADSDNRRQEREKAQKALHDLFKK